MRKYLFALSVLLVLSVLSAFTPLKAIFAAETPVCACYFGEKVGDVFDCKMESVNAGSTAIACHITCNNIHTPECKGKCIPGSKEPCLPKCKNYVFHDGPTMKATVTTQCYGAHTAVLAAAAAGYFVGTPDAGAVIPKLEVEIPFLTFEAPKKNSAYLQVDFLAQYLDALYTYLLGIAVTIAIVMLMIGGFQYVVGAVKSDEVGKGKKRIKSALTGLFLLFGITLILTIVNPNLVSFDPLLFEYPPTHELQDVLEDYDNDAKAASKDIVTNLIKPVPSEFEKCSSEAALDAAEKLQDLKICVGPCHCAFSASRLLRHLDCTKITNGSAYRLAAELNREADWVAEDITPTNMGNLAVGLLVKNGHVGVSLGNNQYFDSGGKKMSFVSATCPRDFRESLGKPELCAECSKLIPEEAPSTGRFGAPSLGGTGGAPTCLNNQVWGISKMYAGWKWLIRPLRKNEIPQVKICCSGGKLGKKWVISKVLCDGFNGTVTADSLEACTN